MTKNSARIREIAETFFGNAQAEGLAGNRIVDERVAITDARDANKMRLRALRLAQEAAPPPAQQRRPRKIDLG